MSVSAQVLGDVHVKVKAFDKLFAELGENLENVDVKMFTKFALAMQGRMIEGGLKYGPGSWKVVDLLAEMSEELYDVANYAFLEITKLGDGIDPDYKFFLMSVVLETYIMWKDVEARRS